MKRALILFFLLMAFSSHEGWAEIPADQYYPNGAIQVKWASGPLDNSLFRKEYYLNGALKNEGIYIDGKLQGQYKEYLESGTTGLEVTFNGGKMNGLYREFSENGSVYREVNYQDDLRQGVAKIFYPNGKIQEQATLKNDKLDGIYRAYDTDGHLRVKRIMKEDKTLASESYDENGTLIEKQVAPTEDQKNNPETLSSAANPPPDSTKPLEAKVNEGQQNPEDMSSPLLPLIRKVFANKIILLLLLIMGYVFINHFVTFINHSREEEIVKQFEENKRANGKSLPQNTIAAEMSPVLDVSIETDKDFSLRLEELSISYRRLVEVLKCGIFIANLDGKIIYTNDTLVQLLRYSSKNEVFAINIGAEFKNSEQISFLDLLKQKKEVTNFSVTYKTKEKDIVLRVSGVYVYNANGNPIKIQGIVQDLA